MGQIDQICMQTELVLSPQNIPAVPNYVHILRPRRVFGTPIAGSKRPRRANANPPKITALGMGGNGIGKSSKWWDGYLPSLH